MKLKPRIINLFLNLSYFEPEYSYNIYSYKLYFLLLEVHYKCLYTLDFSIDYGTNLTSNIVRKDRKYQDLTRILQPHYNNIKQSFYNHTLWVFSSHSAHFITMLKELSIETDS